MPAVLQQWIEKSEERNRRIQQLRNEVTEIMELNVMDVTYRMLVEFLADEEIEHISEMDYILRKRYEVYMSELIKEKSVSRYLRIFDKVKQEYIRKRIETPMGSEEKVTSAVNTIREMVVEKEKVSIPKLMKKTGLSRGFFYKNPIVRSEIDRALEQQAGMIDPRRTIIDQAMEREMELLQQQVRKLKYENENLKKENEKLKKALARKELNLIKQL